MPSLLEMPPEILTEIAEFVGFPGMFIFRQVCRDLNNFIDSLKPNPKFDALSIKVSTDKMSVRCEQDNKKYSIKYDKSDEDQFFKSLEPILKFQTSTLTEFFIDDPSPMPGFYDKIKGILKSRTSPLKVLELCIICKNQYQVYSIMSSSEAGTLEEIRIDGPSWGNLKLNKVVKLDQWKEAKKLKIVGFTVSAPLAIFGNFQKIEVFFKSVFWKDLVMLKKSIFSTPDISREFIICYKSLIGKNQWYQSLGTATYEDWPVWEPYWNFFYSNSSGGLRVEWYYDFHDIRFETF